jgi:hypothetical protein
MWLRVLRLRHDAIRIRNIAAALGIAVRNFKPWAQYSILR